jgi:signal transduction histidine kinase
VCDLAAVALDRAARARELAEVDRHRKEFLAVLGHELRGPLAPIVTATTLLRIAGGDLAAVEQARGIIERQAHNLSGLAEELLDGARVSLGKITLDSRLLVVEHLVGQGVEISQPRLTARGHTLTVSLPAGPVCIRGDGRRLAQVVANLLANAAKYTPRGGQIALEVAVEPALVTIRVRDDGIGICATTLPRIFNLFEQAEMSPGVECGGLGIGLSLVKSVVELHGGTIEAHSDGEGRGSEFIVRLPRLPGLATQS